jgi:hypothetical protein
MSSSGIISTQNEKIGKINRKMKLFFVYSSYTSIQKNGVQDKTLSHHN